MVTAPPRRVPGRGKADIGGRMRVAQILRDAGIKGYPMPERVAGSTNEVWRAGDYVIRVGFVPGATRLRREAELVKLLPAEIGYPTVIGSGVEAFGEWIVVKYLPGRPLSQEWSSMDTAARRAAVHDIARTIKSVHELKLSHDQLAHLHLPSGEGPLALPHQLPAARILELLDQARYLPHVDKGLIYDAMERVTQHADAIWAHERYGMVHGDLHFENVLAKDGFVLSLVDFEWSRQGPREIDLDILSRFCANPQMHVGGNYAVRADDFKNVLVWWAEVYPEIFQGDDLSERLMLCSMAFELPWLLKFPPTGPAHTLSEFHPLNQLSDLLKYGSHTERLGWVERDRYAEFE